MGTELSKQIHLTVLKVLLAPLLLIQGWRVRAVTPVLPEPEVPDSGSVGAGPPLSLLLMGDSSAAGVGASTAIETLIGQLLQRLSKTHQVHYLMLTKTGKTTANMLTELRQIKPQKFDVVITALGVNDVTSQVPVSRWRQQQQQLLELIKQTFQPAQIIMSGLPPVREFPALPWPLNAYLGAYADSLNETLLTLCQQQQGVQFHSLRGFPKEAEAASDGFHPGPRVYALWAEKLADVIDMP